MLTRFTIVTIFQCIEILNHYVVHQELMQYCRSTVLQKQTNKSIEKEIRLVATRGGWWKELDQVVKRYKLPIILGV